MHTRWLCAFRSTALNPRNTLLLTRHTRAFHASVIARAADDGSNGPRDDGNTPKKENGAGDGDNGDENLFGDTDATVNGESQGRKKPGNGSLKSRTLRNRKPEELPPVQLPKSFLATSVSRFEDSKTKIQPELGIDLFFFSEDLVIREWMKNGLFTRPPGENWAAHNASAFQATAWNEESLGQAIKALESSPKWDSIRRQGDIMVAAAHWHVVSQIKDAYGEDSAVKLLNQETIPSSQTLLTALMPTMTMYPDGSPSDTKQLIKEVVNGYDLLVGLYHWVFISEVIALVNADLRAQAPKHVKPADLRRPVTVINIHDYAGYSMPRDIVQHVATKLEADVLHLEASDIAHIVGGYLGQDAARAPGPISQLGYMAAKNSGKLREPRGPEENSDELEEIRTQYAIVLRGERLKKEKKRAISLMADYLNGSNRGKSDELWEDLKINTALEELVHSADSESDTQRPLIVHINDFNALNMDIECGSTIIGRIRKVVDGLWLDGRKIALVGSCSSKHAPKPYLNALRELESMERVITLRFLPDIVSTVETQLGAFERQDYIRENDRNIVKMLSSMIEPIPEGKIARTGTLGLNKLGQSKLPKTWTRGVLPLVDVYRIASTMIGLNYKDPADAVNLESLGAAADMINKVDKVKEKLYKDEEQPRDAEERKGSRGFVNDVQKLSPFEPNHEERLKSGLVNAEDIRTTFNDVHAPKETIDSVKMLTTLSLIRPEAFSYGVLATDRIPGCLLYGPPGTGKTLLAKAVAKESGANMIEVSGASINNMYVGESEKNVRALFSLARKKEPMVIFIDEADALLGARGRRDVGARRETINQFLREWDGLNDMKAFIMVATNRPFDLDDAVLRRLPRKLLIDLPLEQDRAAILRIHLKDEVLDESVSIGDIAKHTPLYSGSDLKNVCVAAAMAAVREELERGPPWPEKRVLGRRHFDKALAEIGASVSEDMATLSAIRKFDEKYGDGAARKKRKGMGFEVASAAEGADTEEGRVRNRRR
ncbi:AAA-domain-containing protein [Xylariaceae sp. FL0662B]|nr:AAA-domain-containing protein [Xylariaceae sp. FL0662B]